MAVDATDVYWTIPKLARPGAVMKAPVGGGAVATIAADSASGIAVDSTSVYWTNLRCDLGIRSDPPGRLIGAQRRVDGQVDVEVASEPIPFFLRTDGPRSATT